jgi:hypothetical protein
MSIGPICANCGGQGCTLCAPEPPIRNLYYGRDGQPITLEQMARLYDDPECRRVERTVLEDGRIISTVWLGIDHRYIADDGQPLIFETMVFPSEDSGVDMHCERYGTEAEARAGHVRIVEACQQGHHLSQEAR